MPAQPERIGAAGRDRLDRKESAERVELVGQRQRQPCLGCWHTVAGKAGQILFTDRLGHGWVFAVAQRVDLPHDALQAGHLHHHVGHQVCFAQLRCPFDRPLGGSRSAHQLCDLGRQFCEPGDPVQH